jgi:uncharacterized protein YndB with AHSA1/START domain
MATNTTHVDAPREEVWAVLADPESYGHWVVGSKHVRDADSGWPEPGTRFHHTVGFGPLEIKDHTEVIESRAPERLVLRARARPSGSANVILELAPSPSGEGTTIVMDEYPVSGVAKVVHNPLQDKLIHRRNVESLRRLRYLAESRGGSARLATAQR